MKSVLSSTDARKTVFDAIIVSMYTALLNVTFKSNMQNKTLTPTVRNGYVSL